MSVYNQDMFNNLESHQKQYISRSLGLCVWCGVFILSCLLMLINCLYDIVQHQNVFAVVVGVVYVLCLFVYILLVVDIMEGFK